MSDQTGKGQLKVGGNAQELMAGLFTLFNPHQLPMGGSPFLRNVDFSRQPGSIGKRKGQSTYNASLGAGFITGYHEFIDNLGVTTEFFSTSDGIIYYKPSTSVASGNLTDPVEFTTFTNLCIAVNKNIATLKSAGPFAFTPLLGLPPANARYIIVYKNRLFIANTSAGNSRLHFSAASNAEDWTTVNSAGFIDINKDDGDEITGLGVSAGYLFIFKRRSVHILSGTDPSNFVVGRTPVLAGCNNNRTIVDMGTFLIYGSDNKIVTTAPNNNNGEMSLSIKQDYENLPQAAKLGACAGRRLFQYWYAFDSNADGKNDSAYVLDYHTQAWSFYDNINARVLKTLANETLISGGSDAQILRLHDSTENDTGVAINMRWRSKMFDITGSFMDIKILQDIGIHCTALTGKTLTMKVLIDGKDAGDTVVWSLTPLNTGETEVVQWSKQLVSEQGHFIQFEFSNAELDAPVVLKGFEVTVDVKPHQFWGPGPTSATVPV